MDAWLNIVPFESVGRIHFGATRAAIRDLYGRPESIVRKPNWSSQPTDIYMSTGLSFSYDFEGRLAEVELFDPARAVVSGVELLGRPARQVLDELRLIVGAGVNLADPCDYPGIGVSIALRGADGENKPVQSVTASVAAEPQEPEFFSVPVERILGSVEVGRRHVGPTLTPCDRPLMRSILGEGMATVWFGREIDIFFQGIVVEYGATGNSVRIVVNQTGPTVEGLPGFMGLLYSECLRVLDGRGLEFTEEEAEIRVPSLGVSLLVARDGDPTLPIAAIAMETFGDR